MANSKLPFWKNFRNKYRLSVLDDTTLEEMFWIRLSRMNITSILGAFTILIGLIIFLTISYTPLKELIPGYPDGKTHKNIIANVSRLDSVEQQIIMNQQYIDNIKVILKGNTPKSYLTNSNVPDSNQLAPDSISLTISKKDSLFRLKIENENEFDLLSANISIEDDINLFPPLKGLLTNNYNPKTKHYGVDIVSNKSKDVFSCYNGVVIFASWTIEAGYVVQIQHAENLISIYKHLEFIDIKQGDLVKVSKRIGKIGDVGTLSTGTHLHFELWKNSRSINPSKLINFN